MNDQEVNMIIIDFMTVEELCIKTGIKTTVRPNALTDYTESLDALVPVWEKLNLKLISPRLATAKYKETPFYCEITYSEKESNDWVGSFESVGETIQQAAAHTTAKAILELNERL